MMGKSKSSSKRTRRMKRCRNMEILPEDWVIEILCWLPVKSLIRFQCVCKSWRDLIKTKSFVLDHYHRNSSRNDEMLLASPDTHHEPGRSYNKDSPRFASYLMNHIGRDGGTKVKLPWCSLAESVLICKGLICVCSRFLHQFTVTNPTSQESYYLPLPRGDGKVCLGVGFGVVTGTTDFIVVRVCEVYNSRNHTEFSYMIDVYVRGTKTWISSIKDGLLPANLYLVLGKSEYANGAIHWIARSSPNRSTMTDFLLRLLSYDVANEVFYWTPLPKVHQIPPECCAWYLLKQKESIACISCYKLAGSSESCYCVWSRAGDRSNGSWIQQYVFKLSYDIVLYPILIRGSCMYLMDWARKNLASVYLPSGAAEELIRFDERFPFEYSVYYDSLLPV